MHTIARFENKKETLAPTGQDVEPNPPSPHNTCGPQLIISTRGCLDHALVQYKSKSKVMRANKD